MTTAQKDRLYVLVARPPQVISLLVDGSEKTVLLQDAKDTPDGIVVDAEGGYIYWTNMGANFAENDGYIQRMRLDGSDVTTLVSPGETFTPKQLVLDLLNQLMYWSDREGMRVMRAGLDGSNVTVLVKTGSTDAERADETHHCVGIAIDTAGKKIYWTQKGPPNGNKGRIFRAGIDLPETEQPDTRSDVELVLADLPGPIDLEFDSKSGYLYWTDRGDAPKGNTLNRIQVTGAAIGAHEILAGGLLEGIGLARAEGLNAIFTSDLGGFIRRFDGPDFKSEVSALSMKTPLTGIAYSRH